MEPIKPEKAPAEEQLKQKFQKQLSVILEKPLPPAGLKAYLDTALNELVDLLSTVSDAYTKHLAEKGVTIEVKIDEKSTEGRVLTGHIEDDACAHYAIQSIPTVLDVIAQKSEQYRDIAAWLAAYLKKLKEIALPSDSVPVIVPGSGTFEAPGTVERLSTLVYILECDGYPRDTLDIEEGEVREGMMRKESYYAIAIPSLNRIIRVCDEEGNASIIFDLQKITAVLGNPKKILQLSKNELKAIIEADPTIGVNFHYSDRWADRVREMLYEPLMQKRYEPKEYPGVPRASRSELDPWRGFYTKDKGKHFGPIFTIAPRLGISHQRVANEVNTHPGVFEKLTIVYSTGKKGPGYCYEELAEALKNLTKWPRCIAKGDWKGFYKKEGDTKYFGSIYSIADRIDVDNQVVIDQIEEHPDIPHLTVRNVSGAPTTFYDYEWMATALQDYISAHPTASEGEWKNFATYQGKHFGTAGAIAGKYELFASSVESKTAQIVSDPESSKPIKIRARGGANGVADAYAIEDFQRIFGHIFLLPLAQREKGEWKDFYDMEGTHYGSLQSIARKVGYERNERTLERYLKRKNVRFLRMRRGMDDFTGYAYEDTLKSFAEEKE